MAASILRVLIDDCRSDMGCNLLSLFFLWDEMPFRIHNYYKPEIVEIPQVFYSNLNPSFPSFTTILTCPPPADRFPKSTS